MQMTSFIKFCIQKSDILLIFAFSLAVLQYETPNYDMTHRFDIWLNIKIVQTEDIIIMGLYVRNGSVTSATYVSKYQISQKKAFLS